MSATSLPEQSAWYRSLQLPTLREVTPSGRLLDAFCGQGREAQLFAREGYRVTAIDRIPWMIEKGKHYAEESRFDAKFIAADFHSFQTDTPYDVVYTSCWMYSTVQGRDARINFLQRCIQLCDVNGVIVVSYVAQRHGRAIAWTRFLIARTIAALSGGNRQTEFGERTYMGLFWHHLTDETVSQEIEKADLAVVATVPDERAEPTFIILRRALREDSCR